MYLISLIIVGILYFLTSETIGLLSSEKIISALLLEGVLN